MTTTMIPTHIGMHAFFACFMPTLSTLAEMHPHLNLSRWILCGCDGLVVIQITIVPAERQNVFIELASFQLTQLEHLAFSIRSRLFEVST